MDIELIEEQFDSFKEEFDSGELDAEMFQTAVDELRVQDDYGRYWMIGAESGVWYYYDGVAWTQADPREADSLPFIDENGVYWMLGQESNEWHYYNGEDWVRMEADEADYEAALAAETNTAADDAQYYLDDEGRYWTIGKKSGEWYYYDEMGWHKASELPSGAPAEQPLPQQPYQPQQVQPAAAPPHPQTVPFQPIQPAPTYLQTPQTPAQGSIEPVPSQQAYDTTPPFTPPPAPSQPVNHYGYTQPVSPQTQPQQPPPQPAGYSEPAAPPPYFYPQQPPSQPVPAGTEAVPQQPPPETPLESTEPGVWLYFDGEHWLKYKEDPEAANEEAIAETEAASDEEYFDEEDEFFAEDDFLDEEKVIEVEDLDQFIEVVELQEEDIIDLDQEDPLVEAEFQVEVLRPGEKPEPTTSPVEPVPASVGTQQGTGQAETPTASLEATQSAHPQAQTTIPKVAVQPQQAKPAFSLKAVPTWFWTSLGGVIALVVVFVLLVGILHMFENREETIAAVIALETPTLPAVAPVTTPTTGPTPPPTATPPPTETPVPLSSYNSDYFGFSIDYPAGWVFTENDDLVIFAPSTRSLDNTSLNGAAVWVSFSENTEVTDLLAAGLERFAPIDETLNEGAMEIGSETWISAQIRFDSEELGAEAIALVASTAYNDAGYTFVAVAPASEWEDFIPLFQYPVNSFTFMDSTQAVADASQQSEESSSADAAENTGSDGPGGTNDDSASPKPTPTATPTEVVAAETSQEPLIYTVVSGDTLGGIAFRYEVTIDDLVEANNLGSDEAILQIGQELIIPQEGVAIAAVAATATSTATPETSPEAGSAVEATDDTPTPTTQPQATTTPTKAPATPTPPPPTPANTPEPPVELSGRIVYPAYSTDINSFNIWSTKVDGSDPLILAGDASQPQYSRDGTLFAYRSWESSTRGVYFIDFSGGRQGLLTHFIEDGLPTWSADGTLVFSSRREGDRVPRLFRVWQDGNDFALGFIAEYADTLADGHLVARGCTIAGDCGLFILLPDGSGERKISNDTSDTAPAANPHGGRIALMSFDRASAENWEIWTINQDGSDPIRLTENGANDGLPVWSPDGRSIAFVSDRGGVWAIWAMNSDGSNQRKLFNMQGPPDGQVLHDVPNSKGWLEERISWVP